MKKKITTQIWTNFKQCTTFHSETGIAIVHLSDRMMYVANTRFLAYLYEHVKMKSKIVTFKICLTCDKFAFSSAFSGLDCNFEQAGLCSYVNINDNNTDTFDWFRATGTTGSQGTGPSNDHTYGTAAGRDLTYLIPPSSNGHIHWCT